MEKIIQIEKLLQYNISVQVYISPQQVPVMEFCNGYTVRNTGTSNVVIQGDVLAPNESKAVGGNRGEIYVGRLDLNFAGAGNNSCLITQKYYLNIPRNGESL